MKRTEFRLGEFLYGIPSNKESGKAHLEGQRVFIHNGYANADGYGILIGWHNGIICKSSDIKNFMWGEKVTLATIREIEEFMLQLHSQDKIVNY